MSYTQQFALATDATFLQQVLVAMMNQCATVLTEAAATAGHGLRAALAVKVINSPTGLQQQFAYAIITQGGITPLTTPSTVTDAAVQAAVAAVWNAIAGYFAN
jgi:hypothetical protein